MGDIRITMLGYSRSGKTCYMLGMFNTMQLGINAFTILTRQTAVMNRFEELWDNMTTKFGKDRFPFSNTSSEEYEFTLSLALRPVINFDWFDYRGEFLSADETTEDISGEAARSLREKINASHCIFICVSGEHLTRPTLDQEVLIKNIRANRINFMLQPYIEQISAKTDHPFPVVIVITKADLCYHAGVTEEDLYHRIKQYFNPYFARGFITAICPVTLGNDLARSAEVGQIAPHSMHLPVLFAAWASFRQRRIDKLLNESQELYFKKLDAEIRNGGIRIFVEGVQV